MTDFLTPIFDCSGKTLMAFPVMPVMPLMPLQQASFTIMATLVSKTKCHTHTHTHT
jgi:hypothetical protein